MEEKRPMSTSTGKKGPVLSITYRDPEDGWEAYAVIDSLVDGRAAGGVRVTPSVSLEEVTGLARAMTLKLRTLEIPLGGAKYGIRCSPSSPAKVDVLTRFFAAIQPLCERVCGFGPDMGTTPEDLDEVATRIGLSTRHAALTTARPDGQETVRRYHEVLSAPIGPLTVLEARTGIGVAAAVESAAEVYEHKAPLRVAVQGFGQVGSGAAYFLQQAGHSIVGVADLGGYYRNPKGLDVGTLFRSKRPDGTIDPDKIERAGASDAIYAEDCDVMVLAAQSFSLHVGNVGDVRARLIVEAGNLTVTPEAEEILVARNVGVVPDFLTNGGAIGIVAGIIVLGWETADPDALLDRLKQHIGKVVRSVAEESRTKGVTMRQVAVERFNT
jgi:glutamate dehydrogenase (NAD(P)+)